MVDIKNWNDWDTNLRPLQYVQIIRILLLLLQIQVAQLTSVPTEITRKLYVFWWFKAGSERSSLVLLNLFNIRNEIWKWSLTYWAIKSRVQFTLVYYTKNYVDSPWFGVFWSSFSCILTEYSVSLCIQSECWKIRTRITPNTDNFHVVKCMIALFRLRFKNWWLSLREKESIFRRDFLDTKDVT